MEEDRLSLNLDKLFSGNLILKRHTILITRQDGIPIYKRNKNLSIHADAISSLVAGIWQASKVLSESISKNVDIFEFKLSFDSSNQGVFIFPFLYKKDTLNISIVYKDELNPGKLKFEIKKLIPEICKMVLMNMGNGHIEKGVDNFLFDEITDSEVDNLFAFQGL